VRQSVTVRYSVTSTGGTPTGNVTVSDGIDRCTGTVAAGRCDIRLTTAGVRTLTATYGGDGTFGASSSIGVSQTVTAKKPLATISGASESVQSFRAASTPHLAAESSGHGPPVGTIFTYKLDHAAPVRFDFTQPGGGRVVNGKCVARTDRNQRNLSCASLAGSLSFAGHVGRNSVSFVAWLTNSRKLAPGRYTLVMTAITAGVGSTSQRLTFTVLR
jgi:hypothetical protein